jgi:pantothenate kinase
VFDDAAVAVLRAIRITPDRTRPLIVGVAGPPGSGKTTLSKAVAEEAEGAVAVPMDGFHLSTRQLAASQLTDVKGSPPTFDRAGLLATLGRLGSADPVYFPDFDHAVQEPVAASIRVDPDASLVIVEGNYLLLDSPGWRDVGRMLDLRVFLDVPWAVCRPRLIARHIQAGRSPLAAQEWVDRSDRANHGLITGSRVDADLVIRHDGQATRVSLNA